MPSESLPEPWNAWKRVVHLDRGARRDDVTCEIAERAVMARAGTGVEAIGDATRVSPSTLVMLTHGGPRTADVSGDRPVAAGEVIDPISGRTPKLLDDAGWDAVMRAFVDEGTRWGHAYGLGIEAARGHLLHSAISPLLSADAARGVERLTGIVRSMRGVTTRIAVSLCVEDVFVGGIHARMGVDIARRVVEAGASLLVVRTGAPQMIARFQPPEPERPEEEGTALHAAKWVKRALPSTTVLCAGAFRTERVARMAVERGFCDGVLVEGGALS